MLNDLKFAVRQLLKHPGFTVVALLTLALGVGANTAVFSVMYGVLLRPLPYPSPDALVAFTGKDQGRAQEQGVSYDEFRFLGDRVSGLSHLAASASVAMNMASGGTAEHLDGLRVSQGYFQALGIHPAIGREFSVDEDQPAGPAVVILSHGVWQRRFGGDSAVIGRTVDVDGVPTAIVGIMPADFHSTPDADVWSTLAQVRQTIGRGTNLELIGRLRQGITMTGLNAGSQAVFGDFHREFLRSGLDSTVQLAWAPFRSTVGASVRQPVQVLFGAIGFVLLIACANVASLMLGRTAARHRELALRLALGASRARVARQILTESLLLALAGGGVAVAIAAWGVHALIRLVPGTLPTADIRIDGMALLFTLVVAALSGLAFGCIPAWRIARTDPHDALQEAAARTTGSRTQRRMRQVLVAGEVALALVLLTGAGLMIRTVANLIHVDPGFDPSHALSAELWLTGARYDAPEAPAAFYRDLIARLEAMPGVTSAAVVESGLPFERGGNQFVTQHGEGIGSNDFRAITPGYLQTLGIPLIAGRDIQASDGAGGAPVALVNQAFAHRRLHDHALGQQITIGGDTMPRTIVGVVGDVRSFVGDAAPPTDFIPAAQADVRVSRLFNGWFPIHVLVRTSGEPVRFVAPLRRAIAATDPQVPVGVVRPMTDVLTSSLATQRFVAALLKVFAALALVLAMVGIYGLISWFVVRSTREIGIRVALGAGRANVLWLVISRGMGPSLIGVAAGVAASFALTRLLGSMLYHVAPTDPAVLLGVVVLLAALAALASYLPARRAARVDPIIAMRVD